MSAPASKRDAAIIELQAAMSDYKVAVLRGLKQDRCDPCWRRAVLAMPWLFDKRTIDNAKRHLNKIKG